MKKDRVNKRMDKPEDNLAKRQSAYAGDVIHQYHQFPGTYLGPCVNEYPNASKGIPRTDSTYFVKLDKQEYVMNVEDESVRVDRNTLIKIDNYHVNIEYGTKLPVISAITTTVPLKNCTKVLNKSPTLTLTPIIRSYPEIDGLKRLNNIASKINSEKILSNVEAMELIMIPKMFSSNQEEILEKVCTLLKKLKIRDKYFKMELVFEMQCVIHKYAKTLDDIKRLEGEIGLQQAMTAREYQDKLLIDKSFEKGIKEKFDLALKIKAILGIDKAVELSGFTKEELEKEKLNK